MHIVALCFSVVILSNPVDLCDIYYPYPSGLLHWHWGNPSASEVTLKDMGKVTDPWQQQHTTKHEPCAWSVVLMFLESILFHRKWNSTLTHWGRVMHIWVSTLIIIGSDNGLSPGRCQAIIWTNAGILLIKTLGRNFNDILIETHIFFSNSSSCLSNTSWMDKIITWPFIVL